MPHPERSHSAHTNDWIGFRLITYHYECDIGRERLIHSGSGGGDCWWDDFDNGAHEYRCRDYSRSGAGVHENLIRRCAQGCAYSTISGDPVHSFIVKLYGSNEGRCWCETGCWLKESAVSNSGSIRATSSITFASTAENWGYAFFAFECPRGFERLINERPGVRCRKCNPGYAGPWTNNKGQTFDVAGADGFGQSVQSNEATHTCVSCDTNTYASGTNSEECTTCPNNGDGYRSVTRDSNNHAVNCAQACTECVPCDPGYFSNAPSSSCSPCDVGYYEPSSGSAGCDQCPASQKTNGVAKTQLTECKCNTAQEDDGNTNSPNSGCQTQRDYVSIKTTSQSVFTVGSTTYNTDDEFFCDRGYEPEEQGSAVAKADCRECREGKYKTSIDDVLCSDCAAYQTGGERIHHKISKIKTTLNQRAVSTSIDDCRCGVGRYYSEDLCDHKLWKLEEGTTLLNLQWGISAPTTSGWTEFQIIENLGNQGRDTKTSKLRRCRRDVSSSSTIGTFNFDDAGDTTRMDEWFVLQIDTFAGTNPGKVYTSWNDNDNPDEWKPTATANPVYKSGWCDQTNYAIKIDFAFEKNCPGQLEHKSEADFGTFAIRQSFPGEKRLYHFTDARADSPLPNTKSSCHFHDTDNKLRCCSLCPFNYYRENIPSFPSPDKCKRCAGSTNSDKTYSVTPQFGSYRENMCECPAGYKASISGNTGKLTQCTKCPVGSYRQELNREQICQGCGRTEANEKGLFASTWFRPNANSDWSRKTGADHINECSCNAGYSGDATNPNDPECTACGVGKYKEDVGNEVAGESSCVICSEGKYSDQEARTTCEICPANTNTVGSTVEFRDQKSDCYCNPGYYGLYVDRSQQWSGRTKVSCPQGTTCNTCTRCAAQSFKQNHQVESEPSLYPQDKTQYKSTELSTIQYEEATTDPQKICEPDSLKPAQKMQDVGGDNKQAKAALCFDECKRHGHFQGFRIHSSENECWCEAQDTRRCRKQTSDSNFFLYYLKNDPITTNLRVKGEMGTDDDCLPCPPGTEFSGTGAVSVDVCTLCPVGKYKLQNIPYPEPYPVWYMYPHQNYKSYKDKKACQVCIPGKYQNTRGHYASVCSGTCSFESIDNVEYVVGWQPGHELTQQDAFVDTLKGSFTYGRVSTSQQCNQLDDNTDPYDFDQLKVTSDSNLCLDGTQWTNTTSIDLIAYAGRGRDSRTDCLCTPGYTKTSDTKNYDQHCVPCGTGTYKEGFGDAVCDSCPAGKFAEFTGTRKLQGTSVGADDLKGCQPVEHMPAGSGKYTNQGSNVLEKCPAGSFMPSHNARTNIDQCETCENGMYQDQDSTSVCMRCPFGTSSNNTFADGPRDLWKEWTHFDSVRDCTPCPAGTFGLDCTPCPQHEYASGEGNTYCEKCPAGTSTNRTGSTSREDCRNPCEKGQFVNDDRQCENCMAGKYELGGRCYPCPAGYTSLFWGSVACEACPVGTYWTKNISEIAKVLHEDNYGKKQNEREMLRSGAPAEWYEYGEWYMGNLLEIEQPDGLEPCLDWKKMRGVGSEDKIGESCTQLCHRHQMVFDVRSIYWTELAWKFSVTAQSENETFSKTINQNILECPDFTWGPNQENGRNICEKYDSFGVTIKGINTKNWWGACQHETGNMVVPSFQQQSSHTRFHLFHMMNNGSNLPQSAHFRGVCDAYNNNNCVTENDIISYEDGDGYEKWVDLVKDNYADYQPFNHRRICQCSKQDKWYPNCKTCSRGKYSPVTAGLVCLDCPAGKTHNNTRTGCVDCEAGQYARDSGNGCLGCESGTYSASQGATMCQSCLPGKYAAETSSTGCTWCKSGKYAEGYGEASCAECDNEDGQYGVRFCRSETQGGEIEDGGIRCDSGTDWEQRTGAESDFTVKQVDGIDVENYDDTRFVAIHILNINQEQELIMTCHTPSDFGLCRTGVVKVTKILEESLNNEVYGEFNFRSNEDTKCNTVCSSPDGKRAVCLTDSHIVLRMHGDAVVYTHPMDGLNDDSSVCSISETSELFVTTYYKGSETWSLFKFDVSTKIDDLEKNLPLTDSSTPKIACSRNHVVVKYENGDFCRYDETLSGPCNNGHDLSEVTIESMLLRGTILFFSTKSSDDGEIKVYDIDKEMELTSVTMSKSDGATSSEMIFEKVFPVFDILTTTDNQGTNSLKMFVQHENLIYEKTLNFKETAPSSERCQGCDVGEYQPKDTQYDPECKKCPPGSYQSERGKRECQLCNPGTYQSDEGSASCLPCETGFYSMPGSTACAPCPTGTGGDGCSEVYQQNKDDCKPFHAYYWNLTTNDCSDEKPTDKFGYFGTNPYYLPIEKLFAPESFAPESFTGIAASNFENLGFVLALWNQVKIQLMHWEQAEKWSYGTSIQVLLGEDETLEDVSFSPMDTMLVVKMLSVDENIIWQFYNMSSETWIEEEIFGEFLVFEPNDQMFWVYDDKVLFRRDLTGTSLSSDWDISVDCDDDCRVEKMTPRQDYNLDFYLLVETDPWKKSQVYYLDEDTRKWISGPVSNFPGKAPFEITPLFDQSWTPMVKDASEIYGRIPLPATVNPVSKPKYDVENYHKIFPILQSTPDVREWQDHKPLLLLSRDSSRAYAISQNKSVVAAMSTEGDTLWRNVSQFPIIDAVEHGTELFVHTTDGIDVLDEHGDPIQKRIVTNSEFYEMDKAGDYLFLHWTCAHNHWIVGASDSQKRTCDRVCPSGAICTRSCDAGWYAMSHVRVHMDDKTFNKNDHQYVNLSSPEYVQSVNIDSPDIITWAVRDHGGFSLVMRFRIHKQNMAIRNQTLFLSRDNDDEDHPTLELLVIQDPESSSNTDQFEVVARIFSKNDNVEKECEARSQDLKFDTDYLVTWRYQYQDHMYLQVEGQYEQKIDCSEVDMEDYLRHRENTVGMPPIGVQQNTDDWNFQIRYAPVNQKNPYHEFLGREYDFVTLPFYPEKMDMGHFNFTFMTKFLISSAVLSENNYGYFTIFASAEQYNDETNSLQLVYDKYDQHVHAKTQFGPDGNELVCDSLVKLETEIWYMALWTLERFQRFYSDSDGQEFAYYDWIQELTITNLENKNETNHRIHCDSYDGKDLPGNRPTFAVLGMPVMSSLHEDHHKFLGKISGVHWYMEILTEAQITAVFDSILASDGVSVSNYDADDREEQCVIFENSTETTQVAVEVMHGEDSTVAFDPDDNEDLDVYELDYIVRSEKTALIAFEDVVYAPTVQVAVFDDPSSTATVAYEDKDSAPTFKVAAIESGGDNHKRTLVCVNTKLQSTFIAYVEDNEKDLSLSQKLSYDQENMNACTNCDDRVQYGDLLVVVSEDEQEYEILKINFPGESRGVIGYTFVRLDSHPGGLPHFGGTLVTESSQKTWNEDTKVRRYYGRQLVTAQQTGITLFEPLDDLEVDDFIYVEGEYMKVSIIDTDRTTLTVARHKTPEGRSTGTQKTHNAGDQVFLVKNGIGENSTQVFLNLKMDDLQKFDYLKSDKTGEYMKVLDISDTTDLVDSGVNIMANLTVERGAHPTGLSFTERERVLAGKGSVLTLVRQRKTESDTQMLIHGDDGLSIGDYLKRTDASTDGEPHEYLQVTSISASGRLKHVEISRNQEPVGLTRGSPLNLTHDDELVLVQGGLTSDTSSIEFELVTTIATLDIGDYLKTPQNEYLEVTNIIHDNRIITVKRNADPLGLTQGGIQRLDPGTVVTLAETTIDDERTTINIVPSDSNLDKLYSDCYLKTDENEYVKLISRNSGTLTIERDQTPPGLTAGGAHNILAGSTLALVMGGLQTDGDNSFTLETSIPDLDKDDFLQVNGENYLLVTEITGGKGIQAQRVGGFTGLIMPGAIVTLAEGQIKHDQSQNIEIKLKLKTNNPDDKDSLDVGDILKFDSEDSTNQLVSNYFKIISINVTTNITTVERLDTVPDTVTSTNSAFKIAVRTTTGRTGGDIHTDGGTITLSAKIVNLQIDDYLQLDGGEFVQVTEISGDDRRTITVSRNADPPGQTKTTQKRVKSGKKVQRYAGGIATNAEQVLVSVLSPACEPGHFIRIEDKNEFLEIENCNHTKKIIEFVQDKKICGFRNGIISSKVPAGATLTYYGGGLANNSTDTILKIESEFKKIREGDFLRTNNAEYLLVTSWDNNHNPASHITVRRAQQPPGIESTTNPKRIRAGSIITLPGGSNEKEFLHGVVYGLYAFDTFLEPEPAAVVADAIIKNDPDLFSGGLECKSCPSYMQHSPPNSVHQKSCFIACEENEKAVKDDPFLVNFNPNKAEWEFKSDEDAKTYHDLPWRVQEKGGLSIVTQFNVDKEFFDRMNLIEVKQQFPGELRTFFLRLERQTISNMIFYKLKFEMYYYLEADKGNDVFSTCNQTDTSGNPLILRGVQRLVECDVDTYLDYDETNCINGKFCNVSMVYSRGSAQSQRKPRLTIQVDDLQEQTADCDPDPCDNMFDFDFAHDQPTTTIVGGDGFEGEFRGMYAVNGKLQPESIDRIFYGIRESYDNEQWLREFRDTKTKCESCEPGLTSHRHSTECFHPQSLPLEGSTVYHQFMAMNTDALREPYLATLHEPKVNFLPYQEEYHGYEISEKTYFRLNEVDGDWYAVVFASLRQNDTAATAPFLIISNIETEKISFDQPKSENDTEIAMISDFVFFHDQFTTTNFHYVVAIFEDTQHDEEEFFVLFERVIYENHPKIYTQHKYELHGIENRKVKRGKVLHNKQGMFVFVLYEPERSDSNSSVFAIRGQNPQPYESGVLELIRIETSKFQVDDDTALFAHEETGNSTVLHFTMINFYHGLQEFTVSFADGSVALHLNTQESLLKQGNGHLIAIPDLKQRFFWSYELRETENDDDFDEKQTDFVLQNAKRWENCEKTCEREFHGGFKCTDQDAVGSNTEDMQNHRKKEVEEFFPTNENEYKINFGTIVEYDDGLRLQYYNDPGRTAHERLLLSSENGITCQDYLEEQDLHLTMSVCACRKRKQTVRMRLIDADTGEKYPQINMTLENGVKPVQSIVVHDMEMVLTVMSDGNVYKWFYKKQNFALSLDDFRHYLGLGGSVQSVSQPDNNTYVISDRQSEAIVLSNLQYPPLKLGKIVKEAFDHMVVGTKQELMVYRAHDDSTSWERDVFARVEFTGDSIKDYALSADGSRVYVLLGSGELQVRSLKSWYKRCPENATDDQNSLYECRCDQDHYWVSSYAYENSEKLTYQHPVSGECKPCPGNSTADPGSTVCTCAAGFEYDFDNQKCNQCEEGYFKLTPGNEPCQQCPKGFFCPGLGGSKEECPDDQYAEPASGVCTPCPEHSTTLFTGAKRNIQDCTCKTGFYGRRGERCMPCPGSANTTLDYEGYNNLEHFEIGQESYAAMCHCKLGSEAMHSSKAPDKFDIGCRICGSQDFGPLEVPVQLTKLQRIMPTFTGFNLPAGRQDDIGADSLSGKEYEPFSLLKSGRVAFLVHAVLDQAWSFQVVFEATFTHAAPDGATTKWRLSQRKTFSGLELFNFQIFNVESSGTLTQICKLQLPLENVAEEGGTALAIQYDHDNKQLVIASMQKKIEGEREFKHVVFDDNMVQTKNNDLCENLPDDYVQTAHFTVGMFDGQSFLKGRVEQFYFIGHSLNTNPANDLREYTRALIDPEHNEMDKVTAYRTNCTVCAGNTTSTLRPTSEFDIGCTCKKGFELLQGTLAGQKKQCVFCPISMYKDVENDDECFQCPQNETTLEPGADDIEKCICAPGFHSNNTEHKNEACVSCIMGKYNPYKKQIECLSCGSGEYQDLRHQVGCKRCPEFSSHNQTERALPQDCLCHAGHEYYLLYPPAVLRDRHNFSHPEYPTQHDEIAWNIKEHGGLLASFAIRVDLGQFPQSIMDFEGDAGERIKIALTGIYKVRVDLKIFENRECSFDHTFEQVIIQMSELYFVQMWIEQNEFGNGTRISLKVESNATEVDMETVDSTLACQGSLRDIQTTHNVIAPRSPPSKEKTDWAGRLSGIYLFDRPMNEAERQHILSRTKTGTRKTLRVSGAMYAMQDYNETSGLVHVKSEDRYYNDMMSDLTDTFNYDVESDTLFDHPGQSETSFLVTRTEHCNFCPPGKFSNTTSGLCTNCEPGTYNDQKAQMSCEKCEMGKHQDQTGQTVCKWCSAGTYAQHTGLPECTHCARGKYSIVDNSTSESNCTSCDFSQYQNETGQSSCYSCGDDSKTSRLGAEEFYECGCNEGYKWGSCNPSIWMDLIPRCFDPRSKYDKNEKNCECDAGRYKDQTVDSDIRGPCQACAPGTISNRGAVDCKPCVMGERDEERKNCVACEAGTFSFDESSNCLAPGNITSPINATLTFNWFTAGTSSSRRSSGLRSFTEIFNITSDILQPPRLIFHLTSIDASQTCQEHCKDMYLEIDEMGQDSQCECKYPQGYTPTVLEHAVFNRHKKVAKVTRAIQNCGDNEQSQDSACVCIPGFTPDTNRVCRACPSGTYKEIYGPNKCRNCPAGTASNATASKHRHDCSVCEAGTYATGGKSECEPCIAGKFNPDPRAESVDWCRICEVAKYTATSGESACTDCPLGTWSNTSESASEENCRKCPAGKYSDTELSTTQDNCESCARGKYSLNGSAVCTDCRAGTFNGQKGQSTCQNCSAGWKVEYPAAHGCNDRCHKGTYSLSGASACTSCPAGTFNNHLNASVCNNCSAGFHSPNDGAHECIACDDGHGSEPGQHECVPCLKGSYLNKTCFPCAAGSISTVDGASNCTNCKVGTFPDLNRTLCLDCVPGKFSGHYTQECTNCFAGSFSNTSAATECTACQNGSWSGQGLTICTVCQPGFFTNSSAVACQACQGDTYSSNAGQTRCEDCARHYFPNENRTDCMQCEAGQGPTEARNGQCVDCEAGQFSNNLTNFVCRECDAGKYNPNKGQNTCIDCARNSTLPPNKTSCSICAPHEERNTSNHAECVPCPRVLVNGHELQQLRYVGEEMCRNCRDLNGDEYDNYSSFDGTACVCIDGYYIPEDAEKCEKCSGGFVCINGERTDCPNTQTANEDGTICGCQAGQARNDENGECEGCATGKFKPVHSLDECACLPGTEKDGFSCQDCGDGRGKDPTTPWNVPCIDCPAGKYQKTNTSEGRTYNVCEVCMIHGKKAYTDTSSQTGCATCPYYFVANENHTGCEFCVRGSNILELPTDYICLDETLIKCQDYSSANSDYTACVCDANYEEFVAGSQICTPCVANATREADSSSRCKCVVGYGYTKNDDERLSTDTCEVCPAGQFRRADDLEEDFCLLCPVGKYQDVSEGGSDLEDRVCEECAYGAYQDEEGQAHCKACRDGSNVQKDYIMEDSFWGTAYRSAETSVQWTVVQGANSSSYCCTMALHSEFWIDSDWWGRPIYGCPHTSTAYCCHDNANFNDFCWKNRQEAPLGDDGGKLPDEWKLENYTNHYPWVCNECDGARHFYQTIDPSYIFQYDKVDCPYHTKSQIWYQYTPT